MGSAPTASSAALALEYLGGDDALAALERLCERYQSLAASGDEDEQFDPTRTAALIDALAADQRPACVPLLVRFLDDDRVCDAPPPANRTDRSGLRRIAGDRCPDQHPDPPPVVDARGARRRRPRRHHRPGPVFHLLSPTIATPLARSGRVGIRSTLRTPHNCGSENNRSRLSDFAILIFTPQVARGYTRPWGWLGAPMVCWHRAASEGRSMHPRSPAVRAVALLAGCVTTWCALAQPPEPVRSIAEWEPAIGTLRSATRSVSRRTWWWSWPVTTSSMSWCATRARKTTPAARYYPGVSTWARSSSFAAPR